MAQVLREGRRSASGSTGKIANVVLWVLQIGAAGMFLMVGYLKLSGNAQLVGLFQAIGLGQWFRYLTGSLEVAGAILLLIPRTSGLAALMLAGVMVGAVITHVFIVGSRKIWARTSTSIRPSTMPLRYCSGWAGPETGARIASFSTCLYDS